ncbi:MAG: hypothetical protein AUK31_03110 [Fibrobacteres bacterium CG2_30_45_31]|nr:MAG: hypothetical protein AUK31_03110 [Fibrobacteres bacterium CG2_30_45_31]
MAFETPTLKDLIRRAENGLSVEFYGAGTTLRKTVLKVLAKVLGGSMYLFCLFAAHIWKNRFITTCDIDTLDGFGTDYGLPHKAPGYALGNAIVTATQAVSLSQGTAFIDETTNKEYQTVSTIALISGTNSVPVIASEYGADSNLDADAELVFRDDAPTGIDTAIAVTVDSEGLSGGIVCDVEIDGVTQYWGETAEDYRTRLLYRRQNPPMGGCDSDYKGWATRFSSVTDAFVFANNPNVNSVSVALANYNTDPPVLNSSEISTVKKYMTSAQRRVVTADVRVFSVSPSGISMVVQILPFTESVKSSVDAAIRQYLRSFGPKSTIVKDDIVIAARASSTASNVVITSLIQGSSSVDQITLQLAVPSDPNSTDTPVGQIAYVADNGISFISG